VCKKVDIFGLCKGENSDSLFKFFEIKIHKSNNDSFYIENNVFDKLEDTSPILIESGKMLVGWYNKSQDNITISTFRNTGNN
jgi:hypothetical protein